MHSQFRFSFLQVFLNDWASAVPLDNEPRTFYGALEFAADAVLQAGREAIVGRRSHDMEMLVKVIYACVHPEYYAAGGFPQLRGGDQLQAFSATVKRWSEVRKVELWAKLFAAARGEPVMMVQSAAVPGIGGPGSLAPPASAPDAPHYETLKALIRNNLPSAPAPHAAAP